MAPHSRISRFAITITILLYWCTNISSISIVADTNDHYDPRLQLECLKVPSLEFANSVRSTINVVKEVTSIVSKFTAGLGDFRLSNAISDCLDLLDLSTDELSWTLSASQLRTGKDNSTGNLSGDMSTWLTGALGNQDTCLDGFEGTNSFIKTLVGGSLDQVNSLVRDVLSMVRPIKVSHIPKSSSQKGAGGGGGGGTIGPFDAHFLELLQQVQGNGTKANGTSTANNNSTRGGDSGLASVANVVVAADGSGNFTRIMDAVSAAPDNSLTRFIIYVKKGVYNEYVEISKKKSNIMMIGDGMDVTIISGNRSFIDGWTTYRSATFAVKGSGFIARDMTFENTAGPEKHQAVAFRSDSDLSVLFRCAIRGYQDSLYAHSMRQFYRECVITGTVDFIFGNAAAVFQNCQVRARKGLPNQKNTITAQGRKDPDQTSGFSFQFTNVTVEPEVLTSLNSTLTYLGRPWKLYSRTVFMQSFISNAIRPEGWLEWNGDFALNSIYYGEYENYGPGAGMNKRVKWPGFHVLNDSSSANNFTVAQFILGNSWLPATGVQYTAGLGV